MSFWTALVVIIAIVAFAVIRIEKYRAIGRGENRTGEPDQLSGRAPAELEREIIDLKKRLAVLERIATDDRQSRAIAHEIEQLRDR